MKRIVIATVLLTAVCVFSIAGYFTLSKKADNALSAINEAKQAAEAESFEEMEKYAQEINEEWEKSRPIISKIIQRGDFDELVMLFSDMKTAAQNKDVDEYKTACDESSALIRHIKESERPSLNNVL